MVLGCYGVSDELRIYFVDNPQYRIRDHEAAAGIIGHGEDRNDGGQDRPLILPKFVIAENLWQIPESDISRKYCLEKKNEGEGQGLVIQV